MTTMMMRPYGIFVAAAIVATVWSPGSDALPVPAAADDEWHPPWLETLILHDGELHALVVEFGGVAVVELSGDPRHGGTPSTTSSCYTHNGGCGCNCNGEECVVNECKCGSSCRCYRPWYSSHLKAECVCNACEKKSTCEAAGGKGWGGAHCKSESKY